MDAFHRERHLPLSQKLYPVKAGFFGQLDRSTVLFNDLGCTCIIDHRNVLGMALET